MDPGIIVPVVLFLCIAYVIKVIVEAYLRKRMVEVVGSTEVLAALFEAEAQHRRTASLRWGIVLAALALAFGAIEAFGWTRITPGVAAVLLGATGLGHLVYFAASRALARREAAATDRRPAA